MDHPFESGRASSSQLNLLFVCHSSSLIFCEYPFVLVMDFTAWTSGNPCQLKSTHLPSDDSSICESEWICLEHGRLCRGHGTQLDVKVTSPSVASYQLWSPHTWLWGTWARMDKESQVPSQRVMSNWEGCNLALLEWYHVV